jgi:hypothetical protein
MPVADCEKLYVADSGTVPVAECGTVPVADCEKPCVAYSGTVPVADCGTMRIPDWGAVPLAVEVYCL